MIKIDKYLFYGFGTGIAIDMLFFDSNFFLSAAVMWLLIFIFQSRKK